MLLPESQQADRIRQGVSLARLGLIANLIAVLVAFGLVWVPEVSRYWIGFPDVQTGELLLSRNAPSDALLEELSGQSFGLTVGSNVAELSARELRDLAEQALAGELYVGRGSWISVPFPLERESLVVGLPSQQLFVARLGRSELLLRAYRATGDERYLHNALDDVLALAEVERWRLVPIGLLWNDHALAARIAVIAELWQRLRSRSELDERKARLLLEMADRTAARLAKPGLYTFRTNHGVMQNLALLQFSAAFPALPRAKEARSVGCSRLLEQMRHYIDSDGVTLEHSAFYHEMGRTLLSLSIRLFELNACQVPLEWPQRLDRANDFSHLLTRPDRTLPAIGNTDHAPLVVAESVDAQAAPGKDYAVYPSAGFAVFWSGLAEWPTSARLAQTMVTWSSFPSRAHKLADDMSVVVWASGRPWLTNTGYWPYGVEGYRGATGWRGSNAPHLADEPFPSPRATLRRLGNSQAFRFIELERPSARRDVTLRRQIIELDGSHWIIVDSSDGPTDAATERIWTTMPETRVQKIRDHEYLLKGTADSQVARISFLGEFQDAPRIRSGEREPFAGWIVRASRPTPAPSFEIRTSAFSITATVLSVGKASSSIAEFQRAPSRPDDWTIVLRTGNLQHVVSRAGDRIVVSRPSGAVAEVGLSAADDHGGDIRKAVLDAYDEAQAKYPRYKELTYYRHRLSLLMLAVLLLQELSIAAARRWSVHVSHALRWASSAAWVAVGLYAFYVYLR